MMLLLWLLLTFSLFNTILLLWLGFTVILNSDKHSWGLRLVSSGLLLGGLFFISHTAILGLDFFSSNFGIRFWWYLGLIPVLLLPLLWYLLILWYSGYWELAGNGLRRRQRPFLILGALFLVTGIGTWIVFANPFPELYSFSPIKLWVLRYGLFPLAGAGYICYVLLSFAAALYALWKPGPVGRTMGELARERARPWLLSASLILLLVSGLVASVLVGTLFAGRSGTGYFTPGPIMITPEMVERAMWMDLLISVLIAAVVLIMGQALVSYELFTGKSLPSRGVAHQWQGAVLLAAGYGIFVGGSMALQLPPIYGLLGTAVLMTFFFVQQGRRGFVERERYLRTLRPFLGSERLYSQLIKPEMDGGRDVERPFDEQPFHSLCADILGCQKAFLLPAGPMTPLFAHLLSYPEGVSAPELLPALTTLFVDTDVQWVELDPEQYAGAVWGIPLRHEERLTGVLLLGPKADGGLYALEEIELAQAASEKLLDTQAGAEMGRRLLALQRERLTESRLSDWQVRRMLHDDLLPQLHTALLSLSLGNETGEAAALLTEAHKSVSNLLHQMPPTDVDTLQRLGFVESVRMILEQEMADAFAAVGWEIEPQAETSVDGLPTTAQEILFYAVREAIRNAAKHGQDPLNERMLQLQIVMKTEPELVIEIIDNGVGVSSEQAAARRKAGHGSGLSLHSTMLAIIGGELLLDSEPGVQTVVTLRL